MNLNYKKKSENKALNEDPNIASVERNTGIDFSNVKIHYASTEPDKYEAAAFTRGNHIHIKQGKAHFIPHELGHVVQQRRGIVKPTGIVNGIKINQDKKMEESAGTALNNNMSSDARISTDIMQLGREHDATIYTFRHFSPQTTAKVEALESEDSSEANQVIDVVKRQINTGNLDEEESAEYENLVQEKYLEESASDTDGVELDSAAKEELSLKLIDSIAKKRLYGPHTVANIYLDIMVDKFDIIELFKEQVLPYNVDKIKVIVNREVGGDKSLYELFDFYFKYYEELYNEALVNYKTLRNNDDAVAKEKSKQYCKVLIDVMQAADADFNGTTLEDIEAQRIKMQRDFTDEEQDKIIKYGDQNSQEIESDIYGGEEGRSEIYETLQALTYKLMNLHPYAVYDWVTPEKASKKSRQGKGECTISKSLEFIYQLFHGKLIVLPPYVMKFLVDGGENFIDKSAYTEFIALRLTGVMCPGVPLNDAEKLNDYYYSISKMLEFYNSIYYNQINLKIREHDEILSQITEIISNPDKAEPDDISNLVITIKDNLNLLLDYYLEEPEELMKYEIDQHWSEFIAEPVQISEDELAVFNMETAGLSTEETAQINIRKSNIGINYLRNKLRDYGEEYIALVNSLHDVSVNDASKALIQIVENAKVDATNRDIDSFLMIMGRGEFQILRDSSMLEPALHRTFSQTVTLIGKLSKELRPDRS